MRIQVECKVDYRGEESPQRFFLGERPVEVMEVVDRWPASDRNYFKVLGDDQGMYILRHDIEALRWELVMFKMAEA
ncbi:MAG: hypothetical protein ACOY5C_11250 [Pseudomonadota bacterium]|uniref:hypothetical protein n=1 Tax=Thermithiobacillus tepidarius TaxID=929 RepID=UPI00040F3D1B|nr:hypothetical protein [Thermithiobacillus tepidarius]